MAAADAPGWIRDQLSFERLFFAVFFIAIILRLYHLDLKLFHHDEAIHAWFSFRLLTEGIYQYDPVYHGPFLYYATAAMFWLFGDSDIVGRLLPALFGVLLVLLVYPLYRLGYLDRRQALVAALFLAASPSMVYFSRFLRNDIYIAFFSLLLVVAVLYYLERSETRYALLAAAAAGFGMSAKENMPIVLLIVGSYLIFLVWTGRVELPKQWKTDLLYAALVVIGIMGVFYSSFGMHPEVLQDGWLRAIEHWTSMHGQQRLGGPPYFYITLLILYELPILILAVIGVGQFLKSGDRPSSVRQSLERLRQRPSGAGKAEEREVSPRIFDKREEFFRFSVYWMILSLAAYAYLGEKVPWLLLHQLLPMIFVAVYLMTPKKMAFAALATVFLVAMTWHVAFVPADINEPIVQVQNSEELRDVMALIDASDNPVIVSGTYWPLPWYYRGDRAEHLTYFFQPVDEETILARDFDLVIAHDAMSYPALPGYEKKTVRHSYWFSPHENRDRLLEYYFRRDGTSGSINFDLFTRIENGPAAA
ncbi:MAG: TIGR03663 family protein [Methanomicrobiaceae archaeon]|uniref:Glycosyltransferase RgtA/B/C/D-like domain-containing protein n=1 Tax=hydrocarbon metagenome TaxID=938273 RepID=A0A0W8FHV9_9ZZZZ|nr:TIGR03663 family protein [Methanomicrobiaceae archaeon]MDD5420125.1 TIGR03663 family protein [Methanomicrobiaceae archaeon]